VYPEVATLVSTPPPGFDLKPPPPEDLLYLQFASAEIPNRTRDGRRWKSMGGDAPDPFAKLIVDGRDLIVTPIQSNTLRPTWPDQVRANYRIRKGAQVRVQVWDSNPINNHPICAEKILSLHEEAERGRPLEIDCASGARVTLIVEPAHAKLGLGFYYELRTAGIGITRVLAESPAARAGLRVGDQVLEIQGEPVEKLEEGRAQSLINANASVGVKLKIKHPDGQIVDVVLKTGPIYPLVNEGLPLDSH
jgi:membrane-associated protease RseP (regulator of RpoE activity)